MSDYNYYGNVVKIKTLANVSPARKRTLSDPDEGTGNVELLLTNGDYLLLENGDKLLTELDRADIGHTGTSPQKVNVVNIKPIIKMK